MTKPDSMAHDSAKPRNRPWPYYAAVVFASFSALGLFFATRTYVLYNSYPENSVSWGRALSSSLVDYYGWALLFPFIYLVAVRFPIERGSRWMTIGGHVAAGIAIALAKVALDAWVGRPILSGKPGALGPLLMSSFHTNLITFLLLVGTVHLVRYYRKFREREVRTAQLEASLAEARLQALRMQLHPHFLFNTLNAVSALMHRDVGAAERMLSRLGDLLRLTMEAGERQEVILAEELEFLKLYVEIQQVRFADRLVVEIDADADALDGLVPHLLLQPLVENSIRHGIAPRSGPGRIEITAQRLNGRLEIFVRDDGLGLAGRQGRSGVGLANTRARLEQLYGSGYRFELRDRESGGAEALLELPFRTPVNDQAREMIE